MQLIKSDDPLGKYEYISESSARTVDKFSVPYVLPHHVAFDDDDVIH